MHTITTTEAKTNMLEIIRSVEQGEEYIITKHGKSVARVSPIDSNSKKINAINEMLNFKKQWPKIRKVNIKKLIEEARPQP